MHFNGIITFFLGGLVALVSFVVLVVQCASLGQPALRPYQRSALVATLAALGTGVGLAFSYTWRPERDLDSIAWLVAFAAFSWTYYFRMKGQKKRVEAEQAEAPPPPQA